VRVIAVLASVLLAIAAAGCGGGSDEAAPPDTTSPPPRTTQARQAPDIEGVTLDGDRVSLSDFRGRPLFVNVWAAW
jgi:hypothetical protein